MIVEGQIEVNAPDREVWDFLMDIQAFSSCMPGLEEIHQRDDETFDGVVSAKVGPISGKFHFTASIVESMPPSEMKVRVDGHDDVTKSKIDATVSLTLTKDGDGTRLCHRIDVEIEGRLAIIGDMILRGVAGVMLKEFAKRLRSRLEKI